MPLKICIISAEVAPLSKTGGLADVCGALTKFLHGAGHELYVFTPFYSIIDRSALELHPAASLQNLTLEVGTHRYPYSVTLARLPGTEEAFREVLSILGNIRLGTGQCLTQRNCMFAVRPRFGQPPEPEQNGGAVGVAVRQAVFVVGN